MCDKRYFGSVHNVFSCAAEELCNLIENLLLYLAHNKDFKNRKVVVVSLGAGRVTEDEWSMLKDAHEFLDPSVFGLDVLHSVYSTQLLTREPHVRTLRWLSSTNALNFIKYFRFEPTEQPSDNDLIRLFHDMDKAIEKLKQGAYSYLNKDVEKAYKNCLEALRD
jgi:hypothetical protein